MRQPNHLRATHHSPDAPGGRGRLGRADLHIHTLASDGVDGIDAIFERVSSVGDLDVIGIADHERVDGALAGQALARSRGLPFEVIVGEEVSTREGHLLALFVSERLKPWKSMRTSIGEVHEQGGLAVVAHPLFPYPLCAQAWTLNRLLAADDPMVRPDAIEAFNPTTFGKLVHRRVVEYVRARGLTAVGNSDAHEAGSVGLGWTTFPGRTADDLRTAILEGWTGWHGSFHGTIEQLPTFGRQLRKYSTGIRDGVAGKVRRDGSGRDLGYPGGRQRPPRFDPEAREPEAAG